MSDRLLILGASARAAAASARRAGFEPFAIDLFADADTKRICDCLKCPPEDYPNGLFRLARLAPPMPWMYTGGLENYPELVDQLAKDRQLLGNWSRHIQPVRNPFILYATLTAHGFHTPDVLPFGGPTPDGDQWLAKRIRSSAGQGVGWYDYHTGRANGDYVQRFVQGTGMSAVYVSMPWRVYPIATTLQLVGQQWLHAKPFAYCGNIGPIELPDETSATLSMIGSVVTQFGPKSGLFGVDFVLDGERRPHVIEVNPRYPASAEVLDHAFGQSLVRCHVEWANWDGEDASDWSGWPAFVKRFVVGKAIYYAPHQVTIPACGPWDESLAHADDVWRRPDYADIPHPGDVIGRGHPVLTILAEDENEADCLAQLQSRAADLDRLFGVRP